LAPGSELSPGADMGRRHRTADELLGELELARRALVDCRRSAKRAWNQVIALVLKSQDLLASLAAAERAAGHAMAMAKAAQATETKKVERKKAEFMADMTCRLSISVRKATRAVIDGAFPGRD